MKFTIKNLQHIDRMSEETLCFTCTVYVNDKRAFTASNRGQGGPIDFSPVPYDNKEASALLQAAEKFAVAQLPIETVYGPLPANLDLIITDLVVTEIARRDCRRQMKTRVLFATHDQERGTYSTLKHRGNVNAAIEYVRTHYPTAVIANDGSESFETFVAQISN